jgi:hypothetical protein
VCQWKLLELSTHARHKALFSDQLVSAIPDESARERAQTSKHWQYALRHYYPRKRARLPGGYSDERYFVVSTAHHPGLAVVDIDRDGYDDLYVTVRWGKNMLWRNRGDGSFEEIAGSVGLDIDGRSNAAVFADFDNDGDADVFIGRSLDRSLYLMNEQGRFVDRSASHVFHPLPMEVSSVSAADYNGDGLLDIYFSTYHQEDVSRRVDADLGNTLHRIHKTLTPTQSLDLSHRYREENEPYVNQVGPPNLLLVNHGAGRFDKSPENDQVMIWRNSFQATWSDYDQDGDADLYVANDFAPDCLLRNDGRGGFADVTQETGMHELGFGMGASWGDYDNDGDQDLYVSNMFSKAGMRITRQIIGLNPRIADLAQGNYLFRNEGKGNGKGDGNRFQRVSGLSPPALTVARAGWSWGGQFADFDNDGFLDLYVSSGYYSVPKDFETNVDL